MPIQRRYTSADLEGLSARRGARIELLDGEIHISMPSHHGEHQAATQVVALALFQWCQHTRLGRSVMAPGVIFGPHDEVIPDTMWISRERFQHALNENGHLIVAPEIMVEVLAPDEGDERRVRELKHRIYSLFGVDEYWIVDWQQQEVQVFRRGDSTLELAATLGYDDTLISPLLPEFALRLADIWEAEPFPKWAIRSRA